MSRENGTKAKVKTATSEEAGLKLIRHVLSRASEQRSARKNGTPGKKRVVERPHLSSSDRFVLERIERDGPWQILAEIITYEAERSLRLETELDRANELMRNEDDYCRNAFIAAIEAFASYAQPVRWPIDRPNITRERFAAYLYGLDAFGDLRRGMERRIFARPKPLPTTLRAQHRQFRGRVAAFVQLIWESDGKRQRGRRDACVTVHGICCRTAENLGIVFSSRQKRRSTKKGEEKGNELCPFPEKWAGPLDIHRQIARVKTFHWERWLEDGASTGHKLDFGPNEDTYIERSAFLNMMSNGRRALARGEDMKRYCKAIEENAFGNHLRPRELR